jgi:hypothetical protein
MTPFETPLEKVGGQPPSNYESTANLDAPSPPPAAAPHTPDPFFINELIRGVNYLAARSSCLKPTWATFSRQNADK